MTGYVFYENILFAKIPVFPTDNLKNKESVLKIVMERLREDVKDAPDCFLTEITGKKYIYVDFKRIKHRCKEIPIGSDIVSVEKDEHPFTISLNEHGYYTKWREGDARSNGL